MRIRPRLKCGGPPNIADARVETQHRRSLHPFAGRGESAGRGRGAAHGTKPLALCLWASERCCLFDSQRLSLKRSPRMQSNTHAHEYVELRELLSQQGLFDRQPLYYTGKALQNLSFLA